LRVSLDRLEITGDLLVRPQEAAGVLEVFGHECNRGSKTEPSRQEIESFF
jgi:hypothetical protein